jgi:hypothetical protein
VVARRARHDDALLVRAAAQAGSFFLGPDKQYQTLAQLWDEPDEEQPTPQPKAKAEHEEKGREEASVGG